MASGTEKDDEKASEATEEKRILEMDTIPPPESGDAYSALTAVREAPEDLLLAIRSAKAARNRHELLADVALSGERASDAPGAPDAAKVAQARATNPVKPSVKPSATPAVKPAARPSVKPLAARVADVRPAAAPGPSPVPSLNDDDESASALDDDDLKPITGPKEPAAAVPAPAQQALVASTKSPAQAAIVAPAKPATLLQTVASRYAAMTEEMRVATLIGLLVAAYILYVVMRH